MKGIDISADRRRRNIIYGIHPNGRNA